MRSTANGAVATAFTGVIIALYVAFTTPEYQRFWR